jgi:putative thiamine transport system permease protein
MSLIAWQALFAWPGLSRSVWLSVSVGLVTTATALALVTLIVAGWHGTRSFRLFERLLSPLLSVPHAAAAFGLAFLIAPSGWLSRMVSPMATGWDRPPDVLIVQDPWGLTLMAGLVAKEVPFLLLMTLAALSQVRHGDYARVTSALGYGRIKGWLVAVFPAVYAQIRLPVYVVLAYGMSVVDVAVILGPNTPPTLSVQIVRWMSDPDLMFRMQAAAGALLQLGLVGAALGLWWLGERLVARWGCGWAQTGGRMRRDGVLRVVGQGAALACSFAVLAGLAGLAVWSFAGRWRFPDALPETLKLTSWMRHGPEALEVAGVTLLIAGIAVLVALVLVIGCLEAEHREGRAMTPAALWVLYLPLIVPQVAFLPGLQGLLLWLGWDKGLWPVIAAHLVFVLPYVFLALADPFRAWDTRQATVAASLGASPDRILWRLRLPMLLAPLLTAAAVGIAVSVGQYLPTLLVGGGRVSTLATEAVALAAGGDRRAIGVWGLAQTGAAFLPFVLALALPAVVFARRRGMRGG